MTTLASMWFSMSSKSSKDTETTSFYLQLMYK